MAAYQFEPANLVSRVRKFHRIRLCHKREHGSRTEFPRNRSSMLHHPCPEFSVLDTTGKSIPSKMIPDNNGSTGLVFTALSLENYESSLIRYFREFCAK